MRILYALHAYKPAYRIGGPVLSVSAAAEQLARKGHEVIVFATNSNLTEELDVPTDQPIDVEGVEVWYFRREEPLQKYLPFVSYFSQSMGFMYCPAMKGALVRIMSSVDVVDTHMPFVYPTYAAAQAALKARKPLFYHQRGNFNPARLAFRSGKKKLYISLIERPIMRRATTLIALTEAERSWFRALGVNTPCAVIPNGIDLPLPRPDAVARVTERFGIAASATVVLFLGRLHPMKGVEELIDAFSRIAARHPNSVLVMAGPDEWGLQARWYDRVQQAGLGRSVVFAGMLTGSDKADMLARANLFALPSSGEGFSMAVLEAMASSTAVMLSPGCNFPEVVEFGAGITVDIDVAAMAAALSRLLQEPDLLRSMGEAARRLVAEHYSWDIITDRLIHVYTDGIDRDRAQARHSVTSWATHSIGTIHK